MQRFRYFIAQGITALILVVGIQVIHDSNAFASTWVQSNTSGFSTNTSNFYSVAASADGTKAVLVGAGVSGMVPYTSTNSGTDWVAQNTSFGGISNFPTGLALNGVASSSVSYTHLTLPTIYSV